MKRLLITGNSHVAALRLGWDRIRADYADRIDLSFFAAPQPTFEKFGLADDDRFGVIDPDLFHANQIDMVRTVNGQLDIRLAQFDLVLASGVYFGLGQLSSLFRDFSIDGLHEVDRPRRLSLAAFVDMMQDVIAQHDVPPHWDQVRGPRIFVQPTPRPADVAVVPGTPVKKSNRWCDPKLGLTDLGPLFALHDAQVAAHLQTRGFAMLGLPDTVLTGRGLTDPKFSLDSQHMLGKSHADDDMIHMNADYGAICLRQSLDQLLRQD